MFLIKLLAALLLLCHSISAHWLPHWPPTPNPLCSNQFALVNRACLLVPSKPGPIHGDGLETEAVAVVRHHGRGHRHHGRGHRGGHEAARRQESAAEEECCRWLKEVDSMCACELLVHLPLFLVKPAHSYTVVVDEMCIVTFKCGGSMSKKLLA